MASAQSEILEALETRLKAVLNNSWKRLSYSYELEKNSFRDSKYGYAVQVLGGSTVEGTTIAATIDQEFAIILTARYENKSSDKEEREAIKFIYDNLETAYLDIYTSKIGLTSNELRVLNVNELSVEEVERISDNVIGVRASFTIKHRKLIT